MRQSKGSLGTTSNGKRYSFSGVIINKDTGESGQESGKPPEAPAVDDVSLHTTSRIFPDFLADTPLNKDGKSYRRDVTAGSRAT